MWVRLKNNDASILQLIVNEGSNELFYLPQQPTGLYIDGNVRSLSVLTAPDSYKLIVGKNNLPIKTLEIAKKR